MALAQGLEQRGNLHCEFLYDAEKVMRKTVERLRPAEFAPAGQHQNEALALLIKAREALRVAFGKSPPSEATRRFDREQAQKLRKPKDQNEQAEMLAGRLRQLAEEEEFVYATLGGVPCEQGSPTKTTAQAQNAANSSASKQADATHRTAASRPAAASSSPAGQGRPGEAGADQPVDRQQLEQRQRDVVLDAYEAQRLLEGLKGTTELARSRMQRGTQNAEDASGALARGDMEAAREAAGEAGGRFRELARHVEGLTAAELAGKIGVARSGGGVGGTSARFGEPPRPRGTTRGGRQHQSQVPIAVGQRWTSIHTREKGPSRRGARQLRQ